MFGWFKKKKLRLVAKRNLQRYMVDGWRISKANKRSVTDLILMEK